MVHAHFNQNKVLHLVVRQVVDFIKWLSFMRKQLVAWWHYVFDKLIVSLDIQRIRLVIRILLTSVDRNKWL